MAFRCWGAGDRSGLTSGDSLRVSALRAVRPERTPQSKVPCAIAGKAKRPNPLGFPSRRGKGEASRYTVGDFLHRGSVNIGEGGECLLFANAGSARNPVGRKAALAAFPRSDNFWTACRGLLGRWRIVFRDLRERRAWSGARRSPGDGGACELDPGARMRVLRARRGEVGNQREPNRGRFGSQTGARQDGSTDCALACASGAGEETGGRAGLQTGAGQIGSGVRASTVDGWGGGGAGGLRRWLAGWGPGGIGAHREGHLPCRMRAGWPVRCAGGKPGGRGRGRVGWASECAAGWPVRWAGMAPGTSDRAGAVSRGAQGGARWGRGERGFLRKVQPRMA